MKAKIKAKALEECTTIFDIEVPKESIDKAFDEVYADISRISKIPGFREGKAPMDLVRKHYADSAKEEVLKRLIPEAYRLALAEHKINPIGMPEISDVSFEEGKAISFKAKVETRPRLKLKDYKGIKVDKKKVDIKDDEIAKTLENLREMNAKYKAVEDRPVQFGDYAVVDLDCLADGKPIHKKRENLWLFLEKETLVPELHEKMVGMNKAEERDITVVLPEKYPDKNHAGKPVTYHVKLKEIKSRELPALDDEFAKDLGKENLNALKAEVRSEMEKHKKASVEFETESQLLDKLIDDNVFPVPSGLVARQLEYMVEDAKERLVRKGFKKEDLDKKDKELQDKFKADAQRRIRLLFILNEIAGAEKIEANDDDVKEAYRLISVQTGKSEKEVREHYEKEGIVEDLKEKLKEEKTIRFLLNNADIVEKEA
ncbi:MAG: trigger factor [Candidatus Omnitrophica bacterium]|nr:trigger factor [Candidatus Omnitrophota bacterium]